MKEISLWRRFLDNALLEKYDSTLSLIGKVVWPVTTLLLALCFYPDISTLLGQLANNLGRTSKVSIAGVEIEVYEGFRRSGDSEAYQLIGDMSREELLFVSEVGEFTIQLDSNGFTPEYQERIDRLVSLGLVEVKEMPESANGFNAGVEIRLTELGKRVYVELRSIMFFLIEGLPSERN